MRDEHRNPDHVELSLDGRQLFGIVAGSLATLAVVFALGVGFGRQLATAPSAGPAPADLSQLDANPNGPALPPESKYTFHEQLVKVDAPLAAPAPRPPVVAAAEPAPAPAPIAADPSTADPSTAGPVAAGPVTAAPSAPVPAEPAPAALPPAPPTPPAVPIAKLEPAPVVVPAPAAVAVARKDPASSADRWTVQFGASAQRTDADRLAATLLDFGYTPYVAVADIPGKGRFYRVRVGRFPSKDGADRLRAEAQGKHRLAGLVMPAR